MKDLLIAIEHNCFFSDPSSRSGSLNCVLFLEYGKINGDQRPGNPIQKLHSYQLITKRSVTGKVYP